jgi:hypothetical protein
MGCAKIMQNMPYIAAYRTANAGVVSQTLKLQADI